VRRSALLAAFAFALGLGLGWQLAYEHSVYVRDDD
jgi:hypothetical protein